MCLTRLSRPSACIRYRGAPVPLPVGTAVLPRGGERTVAQEGTPFPPLSALTGGLRETPERFWLGSPRTAPPTSACLGAGPHWWSVTATSWALGVLQPAGEGHNGRWVFLPASPRTPGAGLADGLAGGKHSSLVKTP